MTQASNYLENTILDYILGGLGGSPNAVWLALYTSNPGEDNSGIEVETGGSPTNAYARQEVRFGAASGGSANNTLAVTFPAALDGWGTITHFSLFDTELAGNMLIYGPLTTSRTVNAGDTISFAAAALVITAD